MTRFPRDAPKRKVIKALEALGFEVIREGEIHEIVEGRLLELRQYINVAGLFLLATGK